MLFPHRFLGIQLVIVLNQNLALQQHLAAAAANGQAAAAHGYNSSSGSTTPLKKQSSQPLSPRRVSAPSGGQRLS